MTTTTSSSTPSGVAKPRDRAPASRSKLRECCSGCALSKVRCSREKPTCSRCLKRSIPCEYLATKRAGRKHDTSKDYISPISPNCTTIDFNMDDMGNLNFAFPATASLPMATPDPVSTDLSTLNNCFTSDASSTASTTSLDTNFPFSAPGLPTDFSLETTASADVSQPYMGLLSPCESENNDSLSMPCFGTETSGDSNVLDIGSMFNDALAADFNLEHTFDFDSSSSNENITSSMVSSPGALVTDDLFRFSNTPQTPPPSPPAKKPKTLNERGNDQIMTDARCTCLAQAHALMKQLFPEPTIFSTKPRTMGSDATSPIPSSVPAILERNRHTIQAVSAMLSCPCSQDVHLLSVVAHIVFKVLEWYEVAARKTPPTPPATPTTSSPGSKSRGSVSHSRRRSSTASYLEQVNQQLERADDRNLADGDSPAQLVLGELHHVQGLVKDLAAKLKTQSRIEQPSVSASASNKAGEGEGEQLLMPFSGAILDLLGVDLRKRYKDVSKEVVRSLKRG